MAEAAAVGRREILKGLDGMSRAADPGSYSFVNGHMAAAVISSAFFCREQKLDDETRKELLSLVETRLLTKPIFEPRKEERADPDLVAGLVQDLDAGIDTLRRYGHNIIFAVLSLKALRAEPDAATPARVKGLREMVQSFGKSKEPGNRPKAKDGFVDLSDEQKFIRFALEEYLRALDLYLIGKGHHGFAGHLLTTGHALRRAPPHGVQGDGGEGGRGLLAVRRRGPSGGGPGRKESPGRPTGAPQPAEARLLGRAGQAPAQRTRRQPPHQVPLQLLRAREGPSRRHAEATPPREALPPDRSDMNANVSATTGSSDVRTRFLGVHTSISASAIVTIWR